MPTVLIPTPAGVRAQSSSLVDGSGAGVLPHRVCMCSFPAVQPGHRESACLCTVPLALYLRPISLQPLDKAVTMQPACLFHMGRGSIPLTPDTQGRAQLAGVPGQAGAAGGPAGRPEVSQPGLSPGSPTSQLFDL